MNYYLPGMEPDFDIRQELRFIGGVLDLRQFDKIFISVSGGKDSQAMLFLMRDLAEKQGAKDRLIAMYADTGEARSILPNSHRRRSGFRIADLSRTRKREFASTTGRLTRSNLTFKPPIRSSKNDKPKKNAII